MSSYDKVVKLACKPKAAPPKPKYLDPIIAATWSEDGAVHDVCKALQPRFKEPNAIVVFKALIVLHTMIRNGATDNVLSYLSSSSDVLRLRNVSAGNWEGYATPQNLQHYASYLDSRIRAYRDLKHDAVRVQAESNRDMRNSVAMEEDLHRSRGGTAAPSRSKTISGRKLRVMTVEKGLLRETKAVQKMIDTLVECRFYLDDLEDELTITALRMTVKDLLILFQAGNEGVINVLEHYFEMSHVDAEQALAIYRHFCSQTEKVVDYLGVAKKLQNLLNVPIPNLKHAPVSLAGALQEYLTDPNFEQNRVEYRANKEAAERGDKPSSKVTPPISKPKPSETPAPPKQELSSASSSAPKAAASNSTPGSNKAMVDFFSAIEEEQPTMFNPQSGSPTSNYFQQQAAHNPFVQRQMTGAFVPAFSVQTQPTGFLVPQQTAFQAFQSPQTQPQPSANPFGLQPPQQHQPFSSFLHPQTTGFVQPQSTGFFQPQATGSNPFRQSMLFPQETSVSPSNLNSTPQARNNNFSPPQPQVQTQSLFSANVAPVSTPLASPFGQNTSTLSGLPVRPASTPLTIFGASSSPPAARPVKSHQTGSRNPFGVPVTPVPPVPKAPTLMELAMGAGNTNASAHIPSTGSSDGGQQTQQTSSYGSLGGAVGLQGRQNGGDMASVASSFAVGKQDENKGASVNGSTAISGLPSFLNTQNTSSTTGQTFSDSMFSSLSTQPTGATTTSGTSAPSMPASSPLRAQTTGFGGIKAFKPSSSFGASLLESLPPIPQSAPSTPALTGNVNNPMNGVTNPISSITHQPTGPGAFSSTGSGVRPAPTLGVSLRPHLTGGGVPNPFRASMMTGSTTGMPFGGPFSANAAGLGGGGSMMSTGSFANGLPSSGSTTLGTNMFGNGVGSALQGTGGLSKQNESLI